MTTEREKEQDIVGFQLFNFKRGYFFMQKKQQQHR
jgi:hypothetical protein